MKSELDALDIYLSLGYSMEDMNNKRFEEERIEERRTKTNY